MIKCSHCGNTIDEKDIKTIDGETWCNSCLFPNQVPINIYPIGYVKNDAKPGKGFGLKGNKNKISEIHLLDSQLPFLHKLEDEITLTILFYIHKQKNIKSTFRRGYDGKKVGVFASRTPFRLNPIGITDVKLISIKNTTLFVRGLDAINETPIIDIKVGWESLHRKGRSLFNNKNK